MRVQTLHCAESRDASARSLEEVGMTAYGTAEGQLSRSSKPGSALPEQADSALRQGQGDLACRSGAAGGSLQDTGETAVHSAAGAPQPEAPPQTIQMAATGSLAAGEGEAAEHPAVAKISHTTAGQAAGAACCCESASDPAPAEEAAGTLPAQQSTAEPCFPCDTDCGREAHVRIEPDQADGDVAHDDDAVGGGGVVTQVSQCNMRQVPFESILELAAMAPSERQESHGRTLSAPLPTIAGQPGSPAGSSRERAKSQPAQRRRPARGLNASASELGRAAVEESSASLASEQASLTDPVPMLKGTEMEASSAAHALDEAGPEAAHAAHVPERETEEEQLPASDAIEQASKESPAALLEGTRAVEPSAMLASKPDSPALRTRKPLPRELAMLQADGEEPLCTQPACSPCPSLGVGP